MHVQASAGLKPWPVHCAFPGAADSCVPALAEAAAAAAAAGHPTRAVLLCHPNNPIVSGTHHPYVSSQSMLLHTFAIADSGDMLHQIFECNQASSPPISHPQTVFRQQVFKDSYSNSLAKDSHLDSCRAAATRRSRCRRCCSGASTMMSTSSLTRWVFQFASELANRV